MSSSTRCFALVLLLASIATALPAPFSAHACASVAIDGDFTTDEGCRPISSGVPTDSNSLVHSFSSGSPPNQELPPGAPEAGMANNDQADNLGSKTPNLPFGAAHIGMGDISGSGYNNVDLPSNTFGYSNGVVPLSPNFPSAPSNGDINNDSPVSLNGVINSSPSDRPNNGATPYFDSLGSANNVVGSSTSSSNGDINPAFNLSGFPNDGVGSSTGSSNGGSSSSPDSNGGAPNTSSSGSSGSSNSGVGSPSSSNGGSPNFPDSSNGGAPGTLNSGVASSPNSSNGGSPNSSDSSNGGAPSPSSGGSPGSSNGVLSPFKSPRPSNTDINSTDGDSDGPSSIPSFYVDPNSRGSISQEGSEKSNNPGVGQGDGNDGRTSAGNEGATMDPVLAAPLGLHASSFPASESRMGSGDDILTGKSFRVLIQGKTATCKWDEL